MFRTERDLSLPEERTVACISSIVSRFSDLQKEAHLMTWYGRQYCMATESYT
jgi:hypothetical protein